MFRGTRFLELGVFVLLANSIIDAFVAANFFLVLTIYDLLLILCGKRASSF
jgi:hypothetical protein